MMIVLLGAPGAGKGTYANRLKEIYNLPHVSSGDLLREEIKNNSETGKFAREYMEKGLLVPNEPVFKLMEERLSKEDAKNGAFLDGFPRSISQAEIFEEMQGVDGVLKFDVSDEVIVQRLSGRRTCINCGAIFHVEKLPPKEEGICDKCKGELIQREDEKPETIKRRLEIYREQTSPLEKFYEERRKLFRIEANLNITDPKAHIIEDCQEVLDKIKNKKL